MNNQELELRIKELLSVNNYFDMIEQVVEFEKEYKTTDFFKKTKKSLVDVIKETRSWYILDGFTDKIQGLINNLDFGKFNELIGQLGDVYAQENSETLDIIKEFKELVK